jgi:uncharacterized protein with HEPN domain
MSRHDDRVTLQQMRDSLEKVALLVSGRSRTDLDVDWVATLALMQLFQIVGEAARRLSERFREEHSEIPWAQIVGLRNRLIHGYDTIDLDRLWSIVTGEVPALAAFLDRALGQEQR